MQTHWENDLADLLRELTSVQTELLRVLAEKQRLLAQADAVRAAAMQDREKALIERLESCHQRRTSILQQAADEGMPAQSLRDLASTLPRPERESLAPQFNQAETRGRLLRHQSLANWVLAQRTLLHLAQLLEIIATGGRPCPTYEQGVLAPSAGTLLNEAV